MTETSPQWYDRVRAAVDADGYRPWECEGWVTWPFRGDLSVRDLEPPTPEGPRHGAGGAGCVQCEASRLPDPRAYVVWRDDVAMLGTPFGGTSLPFLGFLMPRRHADLADLTRAEAARLGELQTYLERAVTGVLDVPRVQVYRWGDGSEHLHWWVYGRPTGVGQLRGTFLAHWDDLLPLRDADDLRADLDLVAARLVELAGGEALPVGPVGG